MAVTASSPRAARRRHARLLAALAILVPSLVSLPPSAAAQGTRHDPRVLDKLYRGQYDRIGTDKHALLDLLAVMKGYNTMNCSILNVADRPPNFAARYGRVMSELRDQHGDVLVSDGLFGAMHPLMMETARFINASKCSSQRVQTTAKHLMHLLFTRTEEGGWGGRPATLETAHATVESPRSPRPAATASPREVEVQIGEYATEFLYGQVADDFVPSVSLDTLPERDIVLAMNKRGDRALVVITRTGPGRIVEQLSRRHQLTRTDDLRRLEEDKTDMIAEEGQILSCGYNDPASRRIDVDFWYKERPPSAARERLRSRIAAHPLLDIGAPRGDCPPDLNSARAARASGGS